MTPPHPRGASSKSIGDVRLIAFYLTQYHPIEQNDTWWGKGFTEWTNVTKAEPLFDGHYQPRLPTDFGFYDLRVRETRREQIRMAKEYGIYGFCYHYYWFSGQRLLEQPLDDMLADPQSDMPFCLCWANENWTRRWDAAEQQILIAQRYLPNDDLEFIKSLIPYISDPRYIRIGGAPFLIVYRPQHLPNAKSTLATWRAYCRETGIGEIFVCAALTHGNTDYAQFGCDGGVEFPPHNLACRNVAAKIPFQQPFLGFVGEYEEIANLYLRREYPHKNVFRGVFPAWDNTPRVGERAVIVLNSSPSNYEYWLSQAIARTREDFPEQERFVFINAWNEWAEGCHLEPDRRYQRGYLEATRTACQGTSTRCGFEAVPMLTVGDENRRTLFSDLHKVVHFHTYRLAGLLASELKKYPRLRRVVRGLLNCFT